MPRVTAPTRGNIFSDLSQQGEGLIAASLKRQKRNDELAREAALAADRKEDRRIREATATARREQGEAQLQIQRDRLLFDQNQLTEEAARREADEVGQQQGFDATVRSLVDEFGLTEEQAISRATAQREGFRVPPINKGEGQRDEQIDQLGFKAGVKRKFLSTLSGDNVLELTSADLLEQADSEIRRLVLTNPNADFEVIQSIVIDELEKALKSLEQKKAAVTKNRGGTPDLPVEFRREESVLNEFAPGQ